MPECALKAANGQPGVGCDGRECVYWRLVEQLDLSAEPLPEQCAIQHFSLLDGGSGVAVWLLSVKLRVEGDRSDTGAS